METWSTQAFVLVGCGLGSEPPEDCGGGQDDVASSPCPQGRPSPAWSWACGHLCVVHVLRVAACGGGGSLACACAPSSMSLQHTARLTEGRSDMPGAQTHTFHCRQVSADGG